jgi:hypothetical protein
MIFKTDKNIVVNESHNLYKWASIFHRLQRNFFEEPVELRREKQIKDFIYLNGFNKVRIIKDTDVLGNVPTVEHSGQADLVVITDQKFSRFPCAALIERIEYYLGQCPRLYLCLNRHYINIDNSYTDTTLDDNFNLAITQWLKQQLPNARVTDLSLDYLDIGQSFTWAIPDRHYYIEAN